VEENKLELFEPTATDPMRRGPKLLKEYEVAEAEQELDLRSYWRIVQKRRWLVLSILLAVFTIALIGTLRQKPVYRAQTLLEIEKENPNILMVQELFQLETVSDTYLETQYKILRSDNLARRVVGELHLDQAQEFNPSGGGWFRRKQVVPAPAAPVDSKTGQAVLHRFEDRLGVEPVRHSRLVQLSFDSEDPQLAARALNALTANYIQGNLENRWEATQKASQWLSQQLQDLKASLEKSENDLQQYAQSNGLLFLESEKGQTENIVDERLRQLQDELTKAQANRYAKESLYRLVVAGDASSMPGVVDNKLMQDLTVRIADLEKERAALAPTFTDDYPKVKQVQSQIDNIEKLLMQERKRAAQRIMNEYLAAGRQEGLILGAFEEERKHANLVAARAVQYKILKREVDTNKQLYEGLLQRLKEAGVSAGLKASNIRIVDAAVPPNSPVKPQLFFNLTLALVLGLGGGVAMAFLQEHLDNTLKNPDDVERFLGVPALALIPSAASASHYSTKVRGLFEQDVAPSNGGGKLVTRRNARPKTWIHIDGSGTEDSALAEAFRSLRTSVLLSTAERPPRSLIFLSAEPGEGKTTTASNLGIALAQLGKRVLVVDGDMRRPCMHKLFGIQDRSVGLVSYLTGQHEWHSLPRPTRTQGLDCLVCGPVPPNPSELLSSERMQALVREAVGQYHFVLLDSPPLLNVADARILTRMVEGAILVVRGGTTPRDLVRRAQLHIRAVGGHLLGVVLNDVNLRQDGYHYKYYRYKEYVDDREAMLGND